MKIFQKVHCLAYLKKESDGIRLECVRRHGDFAEVLTGTAWNADDDIRVKAYRGYADGGLWKEEEIADLSDFEGNTVEKVYRKRIECEFNGFLVGITNIVVTGRIGTDYDEIHYDCHVEYLKRLIKETDIASVGVVYFKNNARRYVLLDDIVGEAEGGEE